MFNKPKFNRKDGETRECKECNKSFHTMKPRLICKECVNAKGRLKRNIAVGNGETTDYIEKLGRKSTDLEGIGYEDRRKEWYKKHRWLEKEVKERTEWQDFFRTEFERIRNDEKLWASLTRDTLGTTPQKKEDSNAPIGRPAGSSNTKYPDTRNMSWYDYEQGGWGEPEDS